MQASIPFTLLFFTLSFTTKKKRRTEGIAQVVMEGEGEEVQVIAATAVTMIEAEAEAEAVDEIKNRLIPTL